MTRACIALPQVQTMIRYLQLPCSPFFLNRTSLSLLLDSKLSPEHPAIPFFILIEGPFAKGYKY